MNFKTVRVKMIILFILGCISHQLSAQVKFKEASLKAAKAKIAQAESPYVIYFAGVWCPSCQLMEETTFNDEKLGDQIQKNYLAYKVNVDSEEGKKWMNEYAVSCLTTTIFYSAESQLLERLEKPITSTELLAMTTDNGFRSSSLIAQNLANPKAEDNPASNINVNPQNTQLSGLAENTSRESVDPQTSNLSDKIAKNSAVANGPNNRIKSNQLSNQNRSLSGNLANKNSLNSSNPNSLASSTLASQNNSNTLALNISEDRKLANQEGMFNASKNRIDDKANYINSGISSANKSAKNSRARYSSAASSNGNFARQTAKNEGANTQEIASFNELLEELDMEINQLKGLGQSAKTGKTNIDLSFNGVNSNGSSSLNNNDSETFLSPSTDNLMAQISACKSLLTDAKSLDKLIGILENYQQLLIKMKATQIQLAQQARPSEYKNPNKVATSQRTVNVNSDIFIRNQQIINHLKLSPPVKNGNQYIVQIGKYSNVRNAERLVQIIQNKYDYPIKVLIENKNNRPIQTVYLGEFKTQEEAIAANKNLQWIKRKGIVKRF